MDYKKYAKIRVRPVIFERDTNGDLVLDQNYKKVIKTPTEEINPSTPYDYLIEIEEFNNPNIFTGLWRFLFYNDTGINYTEEEIIERVSTLLTEVETYCSGICGENNEPLDLGPLIPISASNKKTQITKTPFALLGGLTKSEECCTDVSVFQDDVVLRNYLLLLRLCEKMFPNSGGGGEEDTLPQCPQTLCIVLGCNCNDFEGCLAKIILRIYQYEYSAVDALGLIIRLKDLTNCRYDAVQESNLLKQCIYDSLLMMNCTKLKNEVLKELYRLQPFRELKFIFDSLSCAQIRELIRKLRQLF